ncbi:phosphatase 2C-like domain-containing protein [Neohortaea acidophila]|uniref:Protein phosphatase n=1 Tax=Neohortaea acidophila TaxID=245834 RepID=A0A6A6PRK8_9PEZI|nr:phosphatase 2C-like domain-containing protein [Neohortaea acidophila]KAF2482555.1 phosphatase 2C-like domain-containing protein [Neohortaea acidophila]
MLTPRFTPHRISTILLRRPLSLSVTQVRGWRDHRSRDPQVGTTTPIPDDTTIYTSKSPWYFEAGYAGWAKRPSRPFPPPFFSPPSGSFSDPLSTHHSSSYGGRPKVNGELLRGITNGDDALLASDNLIATNDGVGAWAQKERGNAPLWSRLLIHFWAVAAEQDEFGGPGGSPDPVRYLDEAYTKTKEVLSEPNAWLGTTTACSALLHYTKERKPMLYVTQLGDCKCLVVRPTDKSVVMSTEEQWHYFDCPRQLGTNSPDEPLVNAVLSKLEINEGDLVLVMSDGMTDNLWEEEIAEAAVEALHSWESDNQQGLKQDDDGDAGDFDKGMRFVAQELVLAARKIAEDPFAASPFMERAVEEGLAIEGGKLDDISVVAAVCRRRKG